MSDTNNPDLRAGTRRYRAILKARIPQLRGRRVTKSEIQPDFFDVAQVTEADIRSWLIAVPRIDPDSRRAENYVRGYDVAGKIRQAKAQGIFDAIITGQINRY